jgi:XRE family transcriptional regulator, regulator of sulfur utilization
MRDDLIELLPHFMLAVIFHAGGHGRPHPPPRRRDNINERDGAPRPRRRAERRSTVADRGHRGYRSPMITRRDLAVAALALVAGASVGQVAAADLRQPVQESTLFDWNTIAVQQTGVGQYRQLLRAPTATLDELEIHVTTLNPGQTSHPPHKHPNEELVVLASGKLEATSNGATRVLGPGSVIFNASNQLHSVKNVGDVPATYHVINWTAPGKRQSAEAAAPGGAPASR